MKKRKANTINKKKIEEKICVKKTKQNGKKHEIKTITKILITRLTVIT